MPPEPSTGEMVLHPEIRPRIAPGEHQLELRQTFDVDGQTRTVQREVHHLEVTGPRVTLPGTELFSVSPPPNAEGAFAGRLAQVALRRRTLPWERSEPLGSGAPWLALVILTDEEAAYLTDVPVAEAFTDGVADRLQGLDLGPSRCDTLEVLDAVVERTFPTRVELSALCHGRQVSLDDTEYADEDGFVSVVICNRLPQPGTRYAAYLLSLEGQHDELPTDPQVAEEAGPAWVFEFFLKDELREELVLNWHLAHDTVPFGTAGTAGTAGTVTSGTAGSGTAASGTAGAGATGGLGGAAGAITSAVLPSVLAGLPGELTDRVTGTAAARLAEERAVRDAAVADGRAGRFAAAQDTGTALARGMVSHVIDHARLEDLIAIPVTRTLRFPVLARWEFACTTEDRDFRAYLRGVDIGLLGEEQEDPPEELRPLRATETGHLPLTHVDRSGRTGRAWYRGPFSPVKITRGEAVPLHHADQARTLVPDDDGTAEDLGYAAAFELGRLLGMADLSFVGGMRRLVAAGFRQPVQVVLGERFGELLDLPLLDVAALRDLPRMLAEELLLDDRLGPHLTPGFGTILPRHELETLLDPDTDLAVLATGLSVQQAAVDAALGGTLTGAPPRPPAMDRPVVAFDDLAGGRTEVLGDLTARLTVDVAGRLRELAAGDRLLVEAGQEGLLGDDRLADGLREAIEVLGVGGDRPSLLGRADVFSDAILAGRLQVRDEVTDDDRLAVDDVRLADTLRFDPAVADRIGRFLGGPR